MPNRQVSEWKRSLKTPAIILWLAVWVLASWMLYRQWKGGSPWPAGAFMPFLGRVGIVVELPQWALVMMWAATMVGAFMLSRAMWKKYVA